MSRAASRPASLGLSIEDATGDPIVAALRAAARRRACARCALLKAIDQSRAEVLLTARAECFRACRAIVMRFASPSGGLQAFC